MAPSPSPSPVLGSDELYSAAGWVDDGRRAESGAGPGLPAGGAAAAGERGGAVSVGEAADSLARGGWRAEPFVRSWSKDSEAGLAESSDEEDTGLALGAGGGGAEGEALRESADEDVVSRRMAALVSQSIELEPTTVLAPARLPINRRAAAELGWAGRRGRAVLALGDLPAVQPQQAAKQAAHAPAEPARRDGHCSRRLLRLLCRGRERRLGL
mmetsp:Transcript_24276/g.61509  ORF Transcript_24276/g.61509 Transcript_24276/m.61509 type:complete len:213 (-) Transcript_24276:123-761(-)